jgi:hypothetical protein
MDTLTVPVPTLEFEAAASGAAIMEQPVKVSVSGPSKLGVNVDPLTVIGAMVVYRQLSSSSVDEIWDEAVKAWTATTSTDPTTTTGLALAPGDPSWSTQVVASAAKDSDDNPQFQAAAGGFPAYTFRCLFESLDKTAFGISDASASVSFVSLEDSALLVIGPGEGEKATNATLARIVLKNSSLTTIGQIVIQSSGTTATVKLENSTGASILIGTDGDIVLTPKSGGSVHVEGKLLTDSGNVDGTT